MPTLSASHRRHIEQIVTPQRARFDERERRVYSHDTAVLPAPMRAFAGACLADGVVQPASELELAELLQYASEHAIPVVPRGKGTAGYGGAVPTHGGLVVDLSRLRGVRRIDRQRMTVSVGAGTVWCDLEAELATSGLGLRMYPTSAPSSTVGGWLAQGGAGIGSHRYGWFHQNVQSVRIVNALGEIRELGREQLLEVADAEGTTGIIWELTLDVQPHASLEHCAIAFSNATSLADALQALVARRAPIWSLTLVNPELARTRTRFEDGGSGLPSDVYSLIAVYSSETAAEVVDTLRDVAEARGGRRLPLAVARHEWAERFRPMRLKRLGPSLVPVEIVVPSTRLDDVLRGLEQKLSVPLPLEGVSVRGEDVVLLGLLPHDERKLAYTAGFGLMVSAIRIAEKHGGRAYSTGRYIGHRAKQILGSERIGLLQAAKQMNDPRGVLNPGKVIFGGDALSRLVRVAAATEPVVRMLASIVGRPRVVAEDTETARGQARRGISSDIARHTYACAQCGYCVDICPQFEADRWESSSPRGKWSLLKDVQQGRDRIDNRMIDIFTACTACGKCDAVCQLDLPILSSWGSMRAAMFSGMLTRTS